MKVLAGDGCRPPLRPATFDRVLIDAPCTGLGTLRRRADARWRMDAAGLERLSGLQGHLVDGAAGLVRPGGTLVYSVCTLTERETVGVDEHLAKVHPALEPLAPPDPPWRPWGRGALLLPHDADTDGMFVLRLRGPE